MMGENKHQNLLIALTQRLGVNRGVKSGHVAA